MSAGEYLAGLAFFLATLGGVGLGTAVIVRRRLSGLAGAPLVLGAATVGILGVIVVHLLPLALGVLSRPTVLLAAAAWAGASWLVPAVAGPVCAPTPPRDRRSGWLSWLIAGVAVAGIAVWVIAYLKERATAGVDAADYTVFHLPGIARWIQTQTVWENIEFVPAFSIGTYPNNGDVAFLATVLPWKTDAFVRLVNVPFLALMGVAVYAIARELRAPAATAVLGAAVVVSMHSALVMAVDRVKPDAMMLACFGTGVLFLLRRCRAGRRADLVLAGLGLGLAFGSRWNAAMAVAVVALVWAGASLVVRRRIAPVAVDALLLAGLIALAGGFWLVRNLAVTGNPVFPAEVKALGVTLFDAPRDVIRERYGFSIADYLGDGRLMSDVILPDYRRAFGLPGLLCALALPLAAGLALWARRAGKWAAAARTVVPPALAALVIIVVYVNTPASAQGFERDPWPGIVGEAARWCMPAMVIGGALAAWAAGWAGRWRPLLELVGLVAVGDGIAQAIDLPGRATVVALIVVGALVALGVAAVRLRRRVAGRRALTLGAASGVVLVAGASLLAYGVQDRFLDRRYRGSSPTVDWLTVNAPDGRRVGIAGEFGQGPVWPMLPMFGPRLDNRVAYVGRMEQGVLQQYGRSEPFLRAVGRGDYDLLLVGRGLVPRDGTPAEVWALRAGYRPVARSRQDVLLARCGQPARGCR